MTCRGGFPDHGRRTAYGGPVMRSDLAMAALASAAVPGMKPVAVAGMASADPEDDTEVQRALVTDATGRSWVVHAPLHPVAGARMRRNDELVRQLARHVPFKVPTPAGYASLGTDGDAAVYPHVEGSPLDLGRLPGGPGLASALGRALASVHNIPRGVLEEQDVPVFDAAGCRQRATAEVDRASETGRVPTGLLARWEEAFDAPALWQFATTPVHGSFSGRTVLVAFADPADAGSGRVVAVTDWGEAMVGDPATDLAALYASASPQAWEAVLDAYTLARAQRPDPYLHARARLVAETRALRGLAAAVAEGQEQQVRRIVEVLRRMDRLTEDDDSLVPATARPREGAGAAPGPGTGPVDRSAQDVEVFPVSLTEPDHPAPGTPGDEPSTDADDVVAEAYDPDQSPDDDPSEADALDVSGDPGDADALDLADDRGGAAEGREADPTVEVPRVTIAPDEITGPTATEVPEETPGPTATEAPGADEEVPDPSTAGATHGVDPQDDEGLDDAQRLHELYGMPDVRPEPGAGGPGSRDDSPDR